jgi:hypothetical protein
VVARRPVEAERRPDAHPGEASFSAREIVRHIIVFAVLGAFVLGVVWVIRAVGA